MMMKLQGGHRYEGLKDEGKRRFAYVRTNFEEWNKIFVVDELERTDESLFKNSQATKTAWRLKSDIDSIGKKIVERKEEFAKSVTQNFNIYNEPKKDTSISIVINRDNNGNPIEREANTIVVYAQNNFFKQNIPSDIKNLKTILNSFEQYKKTDLLNRSRGIVESILQNSESNVKSIDKIRESQAKHICEMHSKFVFAALCIVFLFVGAPMGAIVRKGGFGYPFLIAIGFFILFIFMYIMFRKLGEQGVLPAAFSVWVPVLILCVIGAFLTKKATYDERVFQMDFAKKWLLFFKKKKEAV
jgi:lipopolysaccharide export system permease protein